VYPYDLNTDVLQALGFGVPGKAGTTAPVTDTQVKPPYVIFDDLPEGRTEISVWEGNGSTKPVLLACDDSPAEGMYCIRWGNCGRYGSVNFNFGGSEDFSAALAEGACISFCVRSSNPHQVFEVRLLDADTPESKPWRMTYTVSANDFPADGAWHTVTIPLSSMKETGAWSTSVQKWYDAEGLFDWHGVRLIQFSAEQGDIPGDLFIDDIRITAG
jgi:endoglucanase